MEMLILILITILCIFTFVFSFIRIVYKVNEIEKKRKEDMELIKGMLQELNKKTFKPPFDIKTFPESKPSDQFKPFDLWGHTCVYACPTAPYDPNITISTTDTLNEEEEQQ
jgi:hypothetical protein